MISFCRCGLPTLATGKALTNGYAKCVFISADTICDELSQGDSNMESEATPGNKRAANCCNSLLLDEVV